MASGTAADFMVYETQYFTGMSEVLEQNTNVFNAASAGTITLVPRRMRGNYEQASFMKAIAAGAISRRDTTAVDSAVADTPLVQDEEVGVKSNLKIGPVADTLDAWKKIGQDPAIFSLLLGRQTAKGLMVKYVDSALSAAVGAMTSEAADVQHDFSGTGDITNLALANAMALFGDASRSINAWVMHSKVFFDLMGNQITNGAALFDIPGLVVRAGEPSVPGLGRPIIVVDSPALIDTVPTPDQYLTLGLVEGGIEVAESEERSIVTDMVTGQEQLKLRIQGEVAVNYKLKGYKYDIGAGGANPTDAALVAAANWDLAATDHKSTAGVMLRTT